jgi:hypothetical protein
MNIRFFSTEQSSFFFDPIEFDFELPDLLEELRFQFFLCLRVTRAARRENIWQTFYRLLFPVHHLIGMNPVVATNFIDRPLPFERFQYHFYFEFRTVTFPVLLLHCCSFEQLFYTLFLCPAFGEYYILINYIDPKYLWKIPGIINYVFPLAFIILAINLPLIPSENQIGSLQREEEMARMSPLKLNQLDAPENDDKKE